MIIRAAAIADIPTIRSIALATWPVAYGKILSPAQLAYMLDLMYSGSALQEQLSVKGHRFLIGTTDDRAIGFAGFEHRYGGTLNSRLHKLYVLPNTQGTGAGVLLLSAVEDAAREVGDHGLELNVNRFNPAKEFYLRRGFRITRDEVIDIGHGYVMDDHVMEKTL